jgi:L-threonylcarbamoyladenylate synthase
VNVEPIHAASIARAASLLCRGELVAFPTETVYGLGADASDARAVARIFAAKGRPADHPVIVHIASVDALEHWARQVPNGARQLAAAYWPGPLTMVLPRAGEVGDFLTGGQDTIGLRVPAHPAAQQLLEAFARAGGKGVAAPSANRFGHISPTTARHVADDLGDAVALILDGGECRVGIESTIVAFIGEDPVLLRPGAVTADAIARVLGRPPRSADPSAPRAPGSASSHYAPHTRAQLVPAVLLLAELRHRAGRDENPAVLARTVTQPDDWSGAWTRAPADPDGYAHDLYANLRRLDAARADEILIEAPPSDPRWLAVRDRLQRATAGIDDDRD